MTGLLTVLHAAAHADLPYPVSTWAVPSVTLHAENGILGVGPFPSEDEVDPDLIDAGKQTVTVVGGASYFDSATSFAMIRGGHIDVAILGGMQVSAYGDLANWLVPGAMDLVNGARHVVVPMAHRTRKGDPKLLPACTLPLTGRRVVHRIITDLAILDVAYGTFNLIEPAPGVTAADVQQATAAPIAV